jgi:hypothetical protein
LKLLLPLVIFMCTMLLVQGILHAWITNQLTGNFVGALVCGLVFLTLSIFGILEFSVRQRQRSKRILRIKENGIITIPEASGRFGDWRRIVKFQFVPAKDAPDLTIVKVLRRKNRRVTRHWAIVLENQAQMQALLRWLEMKKSEKHLELEIEILKELAKPATPRPVSHFGLAVSLTGIFLLYYGLPLLFVWLQLRNNIQSDHMHVKLAHNQFAQFVANHFSSREEFYQCILRLSVGLCVAGVGLLIWGHWLDKKKKETAWSQD